MGIHCLPMMVGRLVQLVQLGPALRLACYCNRPCLKMLPCFASSRVGCFVDVILVCLCLLWLR